MFKKILIINTTFFQGGAAKIAQALYNVLNKTTDFVSYFAYGRGKKLKDQKTFKFSFWPEVYLHTFLVRFVGLAGFGSWFSTKRLINYIKNNNFDLIHLHNLHGYYLNWNFVEYLKKFKTPIVWTLHDKWPITGRCAQSYECERWKVGCGKCPFFSLYPKTYFFDLSALMFKRKKKYLSEGWNPILVCPSQWLANEIKNSYLNKFQTVIIPNGVDTEIFKPKNKVDVRGKFGLPLAKKIILFVNIKRKNVRKGGNYFLEVSKNLNVKNGMIITMGKKLNFNPEIKKNIEIKQFDYVNDPTLISEIYNSADIFCTASLQETFPTTVLESMACGVPIVGFKVGGIPEQVSDDCGILVESKDVKSLAEAINLLLNDEEKLKMFSLNCRKRALENYSIDKFKIRYINLYKSLLR